MPRKKLPSVTLICVAGVQNFRAILAVLKSNFRVNFKNVTLVSPKLPAVKFGKFSIEKPVGSQLDSMDEYNRYMIYSLHRHVNSEFALIIQADGYVLSGKKWLDSFLDYDFIGAPWPKSESAYIDPFGRQHQVGNGGFSLRSKKLLEVPLNFEVEWNVNQNDFYKHFGAGYQSEDGIIAVHNRHIYEGAGCNFADFDIASKFSRELPIPGFVFGKTFGFHKYKPKSKLRLMFKK